MARNGSRDISSLGCDQCVNERRFPVDQCQRSVAVYKIPDAQLGNSVVRNMSGDHIGDGTICAINVVFHDLSGQIGLT